MSGKNTLNRRRLLAASKYRRADAEALFQRQRFSGAMYLGGYAVECALISLVCFRETKDQFEDTKLGQKLSGSQLHNLNNLLVVPEIRRQIFRDDLKPHWQCVVTHWKYNELRYSETDGEQSQAQRFLGAVDKIHRFLLKEQGATS